MENVKKGEGLLVFVFLAVLFFKLAINFPHARSLLPVMVIGKLVNNFAFSLT